MNQPIRLNKNWYIVIVEPTDILRPYLKVIGFTIKYNSVLLTIFRFV